MGSSCCFIVLCVMSLIYICKGRISDKRLCGDPSCSEPVSLAKTLLRYTSDDARILSFEKNVDCEIYSKSAGSRVDLWGAKIKGRRGYVPRGLVREYKVLKSSLEFVVNTEESENVRDSSVERVKDKSLKNISNSVNIYETSNLEATLNDVEHSGSETDPGSGIQTTTPSLDDSSVIDLPLADVSHQPFSGSGVSAEPIESEKSLNHEINRQPFEVVAGTTVYYETDGKQTELNLHLPQVQPTSTTSSSLPSVVPEKSKPENEPISVPPHVIEPSASTEDVGVDSAEKDTLEGQLLENKEEETLEKEDQASDEKETESISVVDKKETDSVTGKEVTSVEEHKQEAENFSSADETKSKIEVVEDKKEEIIEEPVKAPDKESGENEEDDEEDEEDEEYDDEENEDIEEEVSEEKAELPSTGTNAQKLVEEVKAVNTVRGPTLPADSNALKFEDQGTMQPTLKIDTNGNSIFISDSNADDLDLQENAEVSLDEFQLPENITDSYKPSKEVTPDEPSTLDYASLPAAERQNAYDNANQTESNVGSVEELEGSQMRKTHENVTEGEGSGINEQVETQKVGFDTGNQLHSAGDDKTVERKEVIDDSSKVMKSVHGSDYPEYISEGLKTQYGTVHPELTFDKIADHNSELPSELKDETKSNLSEKPATDSLQEEIETTTAVSPEEEYYEVPPYGLSAEETSTAMPTSTSEEPLVSMEGSELVSNEPSGGLLSGITDALSAGIGVLTSVFGVSSADLHVAEVPEEVNESKPSVVTERLPHIDKGEDMNTKKDAGWSSPWGGPDRGLIVTGSGNDNLNEEKERMSAACKVNYDPSAGIDSDCNDVSGDLPSIQQNAEEEPSVPEQAVTVKFAEEGNLTMDLQRSSYETFVYLIITAATVLLFSLGHYYIEKRRRDGLLVAKINGLEKELLVSSKECQILKDDLQATKEKLLSVESSSTENSEVVMGLNAELEESKVARAELEDQMAALEKELEVATEAGLELNRMLSEFLSAQHGSDTVMKSVEQLQKQLDSQQTTITTMTASLNAKNLENETLQAELTAAKDKINSLEEDMQKVNENLNDVLSAKLTMEEHFLEKNRSLQSQLHEVEDRMSRDTDQLQREKSTLQEMVNELKDSMLTKESEITVLQDCLRQLTNFSDEEGDDKFQALLDAGHVKAELKCMTIERDTLAEKLQDEADARKLLEDHVQVISEEVARLRRSYEEAEREKIEAQTRLEVLSNYFKEKETQLQKELGLQEAMCLQKKGDATSTYERIKSLQEEIENYKSQNETLKKEILDQERGLKCQIATLEKKAHENWVAARQAERKLEESKQEASQLRNRLIIVEKNVLNTSKTGETAAVNDRIPGDSNGELPTSPIHMGISAFQDSPSSPLHYQHHDGLPISPPLPALIPGQHLPPSPFMGMPPPGLFIPPPPPGAPFMPPPPPPLFPGDRRPPPVGRMSSPPPHHYSPPPPGTRGSFSSYDHSPPPSPPPGRPYRSPPPRDDSPDRFRQHRSPPPSHFNPYPPPTSRPPPHRDDSHGFRPLPPPTRRDSPREPKGSALSSGHSSESLEKSSQHSGRV